MARRTPRQPPRARPFLIGWASLVLLFLLSVCAPTRSRAIRNGKAALDPLVQAIQNHQADHGAFPTSLDDLAAAGVASATPRVPSYWNMLEKPVEYRASRDGSVFCLKFGYTGVFDRHGARVYYLSTNGTWLDKPFDPPDVDYEAALLHGQEYQSSGSSTALRNAVTSLWHTQMDWRPIFFIEEALGQVLPTPVGAVDDRSIESRYVSRDGDTYVFVFQFDGFQLHEIHKVQRDECGNERRVVIKKYPRAGR